jgi:hypothetical protein
MMATGYKFFAQLKIVVDLAVTNRRYSPVFIPNRLSAPLKVYD